MDCSKVFFITTANSLESIPTPLLDRLEIIYLSSYTDEEKFRIGRDYLIPRQLDKNGLSEKEVVVSDKALLDLIGLYAREAGVRGLEKYLARMFRKFTLKKVTGSPGKFKVQNVKDLNKLLGPEPFSPEKLLSKKTPGVAIGLAWTNFGGDVLQIESVLVPGKSGFVLTGSLGDVMQESASVAYTLIRAHAKGLGVAKSLFEKNSLHLHVPAGATPKDGPSAGVTMVVSLYSLLTGIAIPEKTAMTGEVSLTGQVLPVGGIKEKLLAAKRMKMLHVFLPIQNKRDLKDVSVAVKKSLKITFVGHVDEILLKCFGRNCKAAKAFARIAKKPKKV